MSELQYQLRELLTRLSSEAKKTTDSEIKTRHEIRQCHSCGHQLGVRSGSIFQLERT
ncbi:MAG: hypothetical protein H6625_00570 [Bdellovibrionaceae bacterium]|nr:hypothetical protein [Pseudobdellovibrionaceae bacterium]